VITVEGGAARYAGDSVDPSGPRSVQIRPILVGCFHSLVHQPHVGDRGEAVDAPDVPLAHCSAGLTHSMSSFAGVATIRHTRPPSG
jgi:hypothetical protein